MTTEEWKQLKPGDVIKIKNYINYWVVKSIGYENLENYTENDYIIEVSDYSVDTNLIFNHYQVEEIIKNSNTLEALKQSLNSDDYISFMDGVEWVGNEFKKYLENKIKECDSIAIKKTVFGDDWKKYNYFISTYKQIIKDLFKT